MPWHRRLEARVAIGVCLAVGLSLAAVLLATARIVRTNAVARAADDLQATRVAFYHLVDSRADFGAGQLRLIAQLPVFRAHLTDARLATDAATIHEMADEYRGMLSAEFSLVTDPAGTWLASPGWVRGVETPSELAKGIELARRGASHRSIIAIDDRLYLVITEPALFANEVLATLTAGFPLDDTVARELALTSGSDVNLISGRRVSASSLSLARREELAALLASTPDAFGKLRDPAELREVGAAQYVSGTYPLRRDAGASTPGALVLLEDWQPTQQFVDQIRVSVLWLGALTFALALGAGVVVSRRMTRPLREIAAVTGDVAAGHWDRRVPVRGNDEAAALAEAFNEMTAGLSHWHTEAARRAGELQESLEQFYAVTQSANDAIISTDASGAIAFWNPGAERAFGWTEAEVRGRRLADLIDAPFQRAYQDKAARLREGAIPELESTLEAAAVRRDGTRFPIELSLATWTTTGGAGHFTAIVRDITERKRAEDALRLSEAELRHAQKMDAVGRLAGGVAHDFNNLLTAIIGYGELLKRGFKEGDPRRDDLEEIIKAGNSAGSLTRQLLAFSRKQILAPKIVDLGSIVDGMTKMLQRLIGEDVELVVRSDHGLGSIKADPGQLEQVIMNLCVNARDAMPDGGRVSIELTNHDAGGHRHVRLTVTDTGCGMDAETLAHIFDPFFTTKAEGRGTGLGLAMVYGIVEQSGATIAVDSQPGSGSSFCITFPRVPEEQPIVDTPLAERRGEGAAAETLLVVEDEPHVRAFACRVLRQEGYRVLEAGQGDEALAILATHHESIHLLVTDVVMPRMNGRALWEQVSAIRPDARVLFMSGYTDDAVVRHGIRELNLPFLQKPFTVSALTAAVRAALASDAPLPAAMR